MLLMTYLKVFNMIISRNEANVSTNSSDEKVIYKIDCYILHALLLVIILLLIITISCYHYAKHRSKPIKTYCHTKNIKIENNDF